MKRDILKYFAYGIAGFVLLVLIICTFGTAYGYETTGAVSAFPPLKQFLVYVMAVMFVEIAALIFYGVVLGIPFYIAYLIAYVVALKIIDAISAYIRESTRQVEQLSELAIRAAESRVSKPKKVGKV